MSFSFLPASDLIPFPYACIVRPVPLLTVQTFTPYPETSMTYEPTLRVSSEETMVGSCTSAARVVLRDVGELARNLTRKRAYCWYVLRTLNFLYLNTL